MICLTLTQTCTRAELLAMHELLGSTEASATVSLELGETLEPQTPGQFSAWTQLVLTWGQCFIDRPLVLHEETLRRLGSASEASDIEVLAVLLATAITDIGGTDIAGDAQTAARRVLVTRQRLTAHLLHGEARTSSVLLGAHTFTNVTSPDLHALWEGELGIQETARTLYHDVWPVAGAGNEAEPLREPLIEYGEVALPAHRPTHIHRDLHPDGTVGDFRTLGSRAPQVRGIAQQLATAVRQQIKPLHDEIGEALFELVQNTEWHALAQRGGITGTNWRVLTFAEYTFARDRLNDIDTSDPRFADYARAVLSKMERLTGQRVRRVTFGSATIIDSGVGLSRSLATSLGESHLYGETTEVHYLIAALAKNLKRTHVNLGDIGLKRVQQSLTNLSGYMSIRTGTLELLRDFVSLPFGALPVHAGKTSPSLMLDWMGQNESDWIVGPRVGTAVTIAYPVEVEAG